MHLPWRQGRQPGIGQAAPQSAGRARLAQQCAWTRGSDLVPHLRQEITSELPDSSNCSHSCGVTYWSRRTIAISYKRLASTKRSRRRAPENAQSSTAVRTMMRTRFLYDCPLKLRPLNEPRARYKIAPGPSPIWRARNPCTCVFSNAEKRHLPPHKTHTYHFVDEMYLREIQSLANLVKRWLLSLRHNWNVPLLIYWIVDPCLSITTSMLFTRVCLTTGTFITILSMTCIFGILTVFWRLFDGSVVVSLLACRPQVGWLQSPAFFQKKLVPDLARSLCECLNPAKQQR